VCGNSICAGIALPVSGEGTVRRQRAIAAAGRGIVVVALTTGGMPIKEIGNQEDHGR